MKTLRLCHPLCMCLFFSHLQRNGEKVKKNLSTISWLERLLFVSNVKCHSSIHFTKIFSLSAPPTLSRCIIFRGIPAFSPILVLFAYAQHEHSDRKCSVNMGKWVMLVPQIHVSHVGASYILRVFRLCRFFFLVNNKIVCDGKKE